MISILVFIFAVAAIGSPAPAADWPQWRYDAGRGAVSPEELPAKLHLRWVRRLPEPRPAWPPSQPALRFDVSNSPVAAAGLLLVPSNVTDSVAAYDLDTGAERWRFYTDGPVRLAPVVCGDRVAFGSDDGYLYCTRTSDGRRLWRVRGGPSDRRVLGDGRLVSTWPVRGGPVLLGGRIYFTAGIWPFMGIFVHAVDARNGKSVWVNSGASCPYTVQPHNSPAFAGFVPRGHLAATPFGLVAPGGRTQPGCYDLATGHLLGFSFGPKSGGTCDVSACGPCYLAKGLLCTMTDGKTLQSTAATLHDEKTFYGVQGDEIFAQAIEPRGSSPRVPGLGDKPRGSTATSVALKPLWRASLSGAPQRLFLKAGSRFYVGEKGRVAALTVDPQEGNTRVAWQAEIEGEPWTMLAAGGKLVVATTDGRVYGFGSGEGPPKTYGPTRTSKVSKTSEVSSGVSASPDPETHRAEAILRATGATEGHCVMFGAGSGRLAAELVRLSALHVVVIDPNAAKVDGLRRRMTEAGLYGGRIAVHAGDPATFRLPPYMARLVVVDGATASACEPKLLVKAAFHVLRPYGGVACLGTGAETLTRLVRETGLQGATVKAAEANTALLVREGPLPGAGDWTHQYADAANTVVSRDERVKAPLGLLWFGGPPNDEVLPRHGHGPAPQVAAGRLVIEGPNMLRALDIYTGRLLWQTELPGLGTFYDITSHQPGAGEIGSNYVTLPDAVYVVYGDRILQLDAAAGKQTREFTLKDSPGGAKPNWGFVAASDGLLVAAATPVAPTSSPAAPPAVAGTDGAALAPIVKPSVADELAPVRYGSASQRLVVYDRQSGRQLWQREARYSFRHNAIVAGGGRLFVIDGLSAAKQAALARRGIDTARFTPRLLALDARSGRELWSTSENVFGTFLGYSIEHDVLLEATSKARDRAADESPAGMIAYRGADGHVLWKDLARRYTGPCMLHGETIIAQGPAWSLLTGEPKMRKHPLTGEPVPWTFTRNYGCNTAVACRNLITFRSAAAGFYDLATDGGTGNLGGFKSGCTSNLVAAGGLLCAPEYTRTCTCPYQNQTSLALIHDPEVELWTFNALKWDGKPVRRVGINFGAPGDRMADGGTLWLDWPSVGGPSPDVPVEVVPERPAAFRHHSGLVRVGPDSGGLAWVAASGLRDVRRVTVTLSKEPSSAPRKYTVRLHFAEPDGLAPGRRVFGVRLQGKEVLSKLDIAKEAGPMTALVKQFRGVVLSDTLTVELDPTQAGDIPGPVLGGLEVVAEGW